MLNIGGEEGGGGGGGAKEYRLQNIGGSWDYSPLHLHMGVRMLVGVICGFPLLNEECMPECLVKRFGLLPTDQLRDSSSSTLISHQWRHRPLKLEGTAVFSQSTGNNSFSRN